MPSSMSENYRCQGAQKGSWPFALRLASCRLAVKLSINAVCKLPPLYLQCIQIIILCIERKIQLLNSWGLSVTFFMPVFMDTCDLWNLPESFFLNHTLSKKRE